jgi:hypothetical protein
MIGTLPAAKEVLIDTGEFESSEVQMKCAAEPDVQAVQADARLTAKSMAKAVGKRIGCC